MQKEAQKQRNEQTIKQAQISSQSLEQMSENIVVGYAIFKKSIQKILKQSPQVQRMLKSNFWGIHSNRMIVSLDKYTKYNWIQIFQPMIQTNVSHIRILKNQYPAVIKQISHVNYPNLLSLSLIDNGINNIEALMMINFCHPIFLSLTSNHINRVSCMNKMSILQLSSLFLDQNPILQIGSLSRAKINDSQTYQLCLQNYPQDQFSENEDLSILVKICTEQLQYLFVKSKNRIEQVKVQKMLKMRFSKLEFQNKYQNVE